MDWKNNQWVGIGAAVLAVLAIIGVFMWMSQGDPTGADKRFVTFECQSTKDTFQISERDLLHNMDTFRRFSGDFGEEVECKACGGKDARQVYFCPECDKRYLYEARQANSEVIRCPERHGIPPEHL